ncbi:CHAD domain-containing protein [Micromonospora sp. M12]
MTAEPNAGEVVTEAFRKEIGRLLAHDPLVRLRAPAAGGDTGVHQMRVACRRLRSDLRTFKPLVRRQWSRPLRDELRWLAGVLGAARDAEVLRARLRRTAGADPLSPLDQGAVDRLDEVLAQRQRQALAAIDEALRSPRYLALVDSLVLAARAPGSPAGRPSPRRRRSRAGGPALGTAGRAGRRGRARPAVAGRPLARRSQGGQTSPVRGQRGGLDGRQGSAPAVPRPRRCAGRAR